MAVTFDKLSRVRREYLIDKYGDKADLNKDGKLDKIEIGFIMSSMNSKTGKVDEKKLQDSIYNYSNRTEQETVLSTTITSKYENNRLRYSTVTDKYDPTFKEITEYSDNGEVLQITTYRGDNCTVEKPGENGKLCLVESGRTSGIDMNI